MRKNKKINVNLKFAKKNFGGQAFEASNFKFQNETHLNW